MAMRCGIAIISCQIGIPGADAACSREYSAFPSVSVYFPSLFQLIALP